MPPITTLARAQRQLRGVLTTLDEAGLARHATLHLALAADLIAIEQAKLDRR